MISVSRLESYKLVPSVMYAKIQTDATVGARDPVRSIYVDPIFGDNGCGSDIPSLKTSGCFFLTRFAYTRQPTSLAFTTSGKTRTEIPTGYNKNSSVRGIMLKITPADASCTQLPGCGTARQNKISKHQNYWRQIGSELEFLKLLCFHLAFLCTTFPACAQLCRLGFLGFPGREP